MRFYLAWCAENEVPPLVKASLNLWVAGLLDAGSAAATARARQLAVRRFSAWLTEEGEIDTDPFPRSTGRVPPDPPLLEPPEVRCVRAKRVADEA